MPPKHHFDPGVPKIASQGPGSPQPRGRCEPARRAHLALFPREVLEGKIRPGSRAAWGVEAART
jgi:hypothetical protein